MSPIKSFFGMKRHPSAGKNATPWRIAWQALPYVLSPAGKAFNPLSFFFIINSRCNMKCQMCDVGQGNTESIFYKNLVGNGDQRGDFPIERFESLMAEVATFRPFISITSSEPLLYAPLPQAIAAVKSHGMGINVTSNGLLLRKYYQELFQSGLDSLTISLDGPGSLHDSIRGVPGAFDIIMEGIHDLIELKKRHGSAKPLISINTVLTNMNAGCLADLIKALPLDELHQITMALMSFCHQELAEQHNKAWGDKYPASRTCLEGACDPWAVDVPALHEELRGIQARHADKVHLFFKNQLAFLEKYFHRPDEFMDGRPCVFPWYTAQVTASGDLIGVTRCYPMVLGNIINTPFLQAWNGDKMRSFRRDLRKYRRFPACTRCEGVLY